MPSQYSIAVFWAIPCAVGGVCVACVLQTGRMLFFVMGAVAGWFVASPVVGFLEWAIGSCTENDMEFNKADANWHSGMYYYLYLFDRRLDTVTGTSPPPGPGRADRKLLLVRGILSLSMNRSLSTTSSSTAEMGPVVSDDLETMKSKNPSPRHRSTSTNTEIRHLALMLMVLIVSGCIFACVFKKAVGFVYSIVAAALLASSLGEMLILFAALHALGNSDRKPVTIGHLLSETIGQAKDAPKYNYNCVKIRPIQNQTNFTFEFVQSCA